MAKPGPSVDSGKYDGRFHGERIVDGDASTPTALLLYKAGTKTAFTLADTFRLVITSVIITCETGGDVALLANGAVAGEYIFEGALPATGAYEHYYPDDNPYICQVGEVPLFRGAASNKNACIVEGYIVTG